MCNGGTEWLEHRLDAGRRRAAEMGHVARLGYELKVPAGVDLLQLLLVGPREVALGRLLGVGRRRHIHREQMLLRIVADREAVDAAEIGRRPAQDARLVVSL